MQNITYTDETLKIEPPVSPDASKGALVIAWAAGNLGIDPKELLKLLVALNIDGDLLRVTWLQPPTRAQKMALNMAWGIRHPEGTVTHLSAKSGREFKA